MNTYFDKFSRVLVIVCLCAAAPAVYGQHGTGGSGSGAGGAVGNAGTVMKVPTRKTTRPATTRRPPRGPDNSKQLEDALHIADDARANGRDEAAERGYQLAQRLVPSDPRAYLGLGHVYYNQKKYADAEKQYARAATLSRGDSEPYARLAFTYNELQRSAEALAAAQRAVAVEPTDYYGYLALGYIQSMRHSYVDAEAAYRKAVSLAPQPILVLHSELVRILSEQRKYREASVEARKEVEIDGKNYYARFDYALMLQKLGQLPAAAMEYLQAIDLDPKASAPHSNVGLIFYMTERYALARQHWNAAVSLGTTYEPDRIGLVILDGRLAEAQRQLEAYTQKNAEDEDGWLMLGDVYRALGDDSKARVTDARAAQIAPEYVGLKRPNLRALSSGNHGSTPTRASSTELSVTRAYMAKKYPAAAADITTNFLASDHVIHAIAELSQARAGTQVRFIWKTVQIAGSQNEAFKTVDYTTKPNETSVHGNLSLPNDWPRGTYKVEIYINNTLARTINYSIQ